MKNYFGKIDKTLFFFMVLYSILGLVMILSASSITAVVRYGATTYHFFSKQLLFTAFSYIAGLLIVLRMPTIKYKYFTPFLLTGLIALLIGLFTYGKISNGAQSWYSLGLFNLQPTEFAKSILIIYLAVYYNKIFNKKKYNIQTLFIPIVVSAGVAILIAMQPDFGSAAIVSGIVFLIFMILPIEANNITKALKIFAILALVAGATFIYTGNDLLQGYQIKRLNYKNPCSRYTEDTGYQVCNGFIAMHNGGLFGVGPGNSTQKYSYLPEAHTDFIFPIIVEELGLFAGIGVIIGYLIILYRILKIAKNAVTLRGAILAYGTFAMLLFHLLINLLGILALIPLTGVPLPLLSYGGSFSINVIIMLFVVQRVAIENNIAKNTVKLTN